MDVCIYYIRSLGDYFGSVPAQPPNESHVDVQSAPPTSFLSSPPSIDDLVLFVCPRRILSSSVFDCVRSWIGKKGKDI